MENEESKSTPLRESTSVVNDETEASNADMEEQSYEDEEYTPRMSFGCAISTCLKKYCTFKGRARRSEFWWFELFYGVVFLAVTLLPRAILFPTIFSAYAAVVLRLVIVIALGIPVISAMVRRLHDAGYSGTSLVAAYVFLFIIDIFSPFILVWRADIVSIARILYAIVFICLIKLLCHDSEPYENKYGPSPKYK